VLGAVLIAPRGGTDVVEEQRRVLAEVTAVIGADDFYRESHREIFRAMLELAGRRAPADAITLGDALRAHGRLEAIGGHPYIAELAACVPTAANVVHYARIVREKAVLRALATAASEIASTAYDSPADVRAFVTEAEARLSSIARQPMGEAEVPLHAAIESVVENTERGELAGIATGFDALDKALAGGGFSRGSLNLVGATTSVGKTAFATNIAVRRPRGGVLFLSVEMSRDEIIRRMIADLGLIDFADISGRRPAVPNERERERIADAARRLSAMPIEILYRRGLTPGNVRREARLVLPKFDGKLDLIVVDYLQLMNPDQREKRRDLEIASITKDLKAIASEFDVPVLLPSQLNRESVKAEGGEPQLWHLRESGAIEQDADVVIFLWEARDENRLGGDLKIRWKISKQRNGPKFDLGHVLFEPQYTRFRN
jgi:replicative DNA helicase